MICTNEIRNSVHVELYHCVEQAHELNMYGPKYVWMLVGWYSERWWEVSDTNCTTEQLATVATYYVSTQGLAFSYNVTQIAVNGKVIEQIVFTTPKNT